MAKNERLFLVLKGYFIKIFFFLPFLIFTVYTGKIAARGIWASKSGETPLAVAEHPDVTPTDVP